MLPYHLKTIAAAALLTAGFAGSAQALDALTIGSGPAGTLYHQIGTTLSSLYQEKTGTPGTVRPFTGTTNYMPLLQLGEIEAGLHGGLESRDAYTGTNNFPTAMTNLRALLVVNQTGFQFITRASDGMKSVADLKGKTVVTKFRAIQGFDQVIEATLASGGLALGDTNQMTVAGVVEGISAVTEGRADAAMSALGIPPLRQADATISGGIRVLTLGENEAAVTDVVGLFPKTTQPGPAQVGVPEAIRSVHFNTFLNGSAALSDDEAYDIAKVVHQNWAQVQEALPPLRGSSADDMVPANLSHPFHPGAIRYFQEAGMWTDAHQAQQDALLN